MGSHPLSAGGPDHRRLYVFDFDDTLVVTRSTVKVIVDDVVVDVLTPQGFAAHSLPPGARYDFSDFDRLIEPEPIDWMMELFTTVRQHRGPTGLLVLSARSSVVPIREYLDSIGCADVEAIALRDADPAQKARWVEARVASHGLRRLDFFDDSAKNVDAVIGHRTNADVTAWHVDRLSGLRNVRRLP